MKEHILQSSLWENFERLENRRTFRISGNGFTALAILEHTWFGNYLFVPYGPTVERIDDFRGAIKALKNLAKQHHAFFIRIEPPFANIDSVKLQHDFMLKKSHDIEPAHTWVLDLTQPETKIFADMEKEKGRLWRNYHKKAITIRQTKDPAEVNILTNMLSDVGHRNRFIPQKYTHLQNQMFAGFATLYIAELEKTPIAAALVYDYNGVRYYAHAAADYEHRKLSAGAILLVQMIIDAKNSGMESFDFWGITTSQDKNHPCYGFTKFKKSFGGYQVNYAGTWDLPISRVHYFFYQIIRKLNRIRRRITTNTGAI